MEEKLNVFYKNIKNILCYASQNIIVLIETNILILYLYTMLLK